MGNMPTRRKKLVFAMGLLSYRRKRRVELTGGPLTHFTQQRARLKLKQTGREEMGDKNDIKKGKLSNKTARNLDMGSENPHQPQQKRF